MNDSALDGAVALVTGASIAVGAAAAKRLAREGAAVSMVGRGTDQLTNLVNEITTLGGVAVAVPGDIIRPEEAYGVVHGTLERFGRLDILVNSDGLELTGSALGSTLDEWDRMIAVNITGLLQVTHAALPYLIDAAVTSPRQVADLVNIGSTAGRVARPGSSVYSMTRFALTGFVESLRPELLRDRVRVSVIEPGTMGTELVDQRENAAGAVARHQDGAEPLTADDVADALSYIVTRNRRVAINQILVRAGQPTW